MKELIFYNPRFERVVRHELSIKDRPITDTDALNVFDLDCSEFSFDNRDYEILSAFKNVDTLYINTRAEELDFLKSLPLLEELNLEIWSSNGFLDFNYFSCLKYLKDLAISGGDVSDIRLKNLEALETLENLEYLSLHEFGTVDLRPLRKMPWLKGLFCAYADEVYDIEAISTLVNLEDLILIDVEMESLDFLDVFPDSLSVELCGIKVRTGIDYEKLARFSEGNFEDIENPY